VPITFGFAISSYVSRLGQSIEALQELSEGLRGKFAGAVGAYNASSLFFSNPEAFEADVLKEMGLTPAEQSSQVTPAEPMVRLLAEISIACGIMANLADDMRHLQRTEIA
jgi:adenylosuccinate lyase